MDLLGMDVNERSKVLIEMNGWLVRWIEIEGC